MPPKKEKKKKNQTERIAGRKTIAILHDTTLRAIERTTSPDGSRLRRTQFVNCPLKIVLRLRRLGWRGAETTRAARREEQRRITIQSVSVRSATADWSRLSSLDLREVGGREYRLPVSVTTGSGEAFVPIVRRDFSGKITRSPARQARNCMALTIGPPSTSGSQTARARLNSKMRASGATVEDIISTHKILWL